MEAGSMSTWSQTAVVVAEVLARGGDHTVADVVRVVGPPVRLAAVAVVLGALREIGLVEAHGGDGAVVPSSWRWRAAGRLSGRAGSPADSPSPIPSDPLDQEAVTRLVVRLLIRSPSGVFDTRAIGEQIGGPGHARAGERGLRSAIERALDRLTRLGVVRVEMLGADRRPRYGWARGVPVIDCEATR
jgi:hypothetical protein